jgi:hypothetical protein
LLAMAISCRLLVGWDLKSLEGNLVPVRFRPSAPLPVGGMSNNEDDPLIG